MTILGLGPFSFGAVPRQLYAIFIRITQVKCFADAVIACPFKTNPSIDQPAQCSGQRSPRRIANSKMVEPGGMRSRWRSAFAFPCVQSDVVVITACRKERRFMPIALHQVE